MEVPRMEGNNAAPWFVGDLDDPWVRAISEAMPHASKTLSCPEELPDAWPEGLTTARAVVLHRPLLTPSDEKRVRKLRAREGSIPRIVLCFGPHTRFRELERWSPLVDAILPEATAAETVARHLAGEELPRPAEPHSQILVVSGQHEMRLTLADACKAAGYAVSATSAWNDATKCRLAVWDVPVLEDDWPSILGQQTRKRRVVALLGIADRITVGLARAHGAAACLDLPFDPDDLAFVLDRLARANPAQALPPASAALRRAGRQPGERHKPPEHLMANPRREP